MGVRADWRRLFRFDRMWIFERGQRAQVPLASLPHGITVRRLDRHARRDWACMRTADADWSQYRIALEYEHDLFLAEDGGQVVGWAWLGYRHVYLAPLGRGLELGDGVGYLYDAYVRPPQRGRGVGAALVAARVAHAESLGLVRLVSHVMIGNTASRRALERAGFELAGRTALLRLLALRLWTRAPVRRVA